MFKKIDVKLKLLSKIVCGLGIAAFAIFAIFSIYNSIIGVDYYIINDGRITHILPYWIFAIVAVFMAFLWYYLCLAIAGIGDIMSQNKELKKIGVNILNVLDEEPIKERVLKLVQDAPEEKPVVDKQPREEVKHQVVEDVKEDVVEEPVEERVEEQVVVNNPIPTEQPSTLLEKVRRVNEPVSVKVEKPVKPVEEKVVTTKVEKTPEVVDEHKEEKNAAVVHDVVNAVVDPVEEAQDDYYSPVVVSDEIIEEPNEAPVYDAPVYEAPVEEVPFNNAPEEVYAEPVPTAPVVEQEFIQPVVSEQPRQEEVQKELPRVEEQPQVEESKPIAKDEEEALVDDLVSQLTANQTMPTPKPAPAPKPVQQSVAFDDDLDDLISGVMAPVKKPVAPVTTPAPKPAEQPVVTPPISEPKDLPINVKPAENVVETVKNAVEEQVKDVEESAKEVVEQVQNVAEQTVEAVEQTIEEQVKPVVEQVVKPDCRLELSNAFFNKLDNLNMSSEDEKFLMDNVSEIIILPDSLKMTSVMPVTQQAVRLTIPRDKVPNLFLSKENAQKAFVIFPNLRSVQAAASVFGE